MMEVTSQGYDAEVGSRRRQLEGWSDSPLDRGANRRVARSVNEDERQIRNRWHQEWAGILGDESLGSQTGFAQKMEMAASAGKEPVQFFRLVAPGAVGLLEAAYGSEWVREMSGQDLGDLMMMASNGFEKNSWGALLKNELVDGTQPHPELLDLPESQNERLELVQQAMKFDEARRVEYLALERLGMRLSVTDAADKVRVSGQLTEIESGQRRDTWLDTFGHVGEYRRKMDGKAGWELMDEQLNQIMPTLLTESKLSEEGQQRLCARLGVTREREGGRFTSYANDKSTKPREAMDYLLKQRVRVQTFGEQDRRVMEVLTSPKIEQLATEAADLLLLHALEKDGIRDVGEFYAQTVRREVLRAKVEEIKMASEREERVDGGGMRRMVWASVEAFLTAEEVFKTLQTATGEWWGRRVKPGGWASRVLGWAARASAGAADVVGGWAETLPTQMPVRDTVLERFRMPDILSTE